MLHLYNSLTRREEAFEPLEPGKVKMYVCGPTVYGRLHIGNGRTFMFWDVARGYLEYRGFEVTYVQNFTDVDDKIINRGVEEHLTPTEVAEKYTQAYFEDMDGLGIRRATHYPKATEAIPAMVEHIQGLIDKGLAYAVDGDVYYRVARFADYGKLSGRATEDNEAGARVEVDVRKEAPADFAMWKAAKPGEPSWPSPWGPGRPGWHIECSAMIHTLLGDTIDIHAGGMDLKFPHHENEIAQSEGLTGKQFARVWMHTGMLNMDAEKMSKSLGNVKTAGEMLEVFGAQALRVFMLSAHYRQELSFSEEAIRGAEAGWLKLRKLLARVEESAGVAGAEADGEVQGLAARAREGFQTAMDADFSTSRAIAGLYEVADELRRLHARGASAAATAPVIAVLRELAGVLGLDLSAPPAASEELSAELKAQLLELLLAVQPGVDTHSGSAELLDALVAARAAAKAQKNWPLADQVRNGLKTLGVALVDQKDGSTTWELTTQVPARA